METLLRYEHVDIAYLGQPAVEDVSFSLSSGEILGIVGESGSGKSTLIKAAMGLLGSEGRVTGGSIRYKGRDLTALPQKELRKLCGPELGYIFQSAGSAFCPIRTVGAQLYEAMREHGKISRAEFEERAGNAGQAGLRGWKTDSHKLPLRAFRRNAAAGGHCCRHAVKAKRSPCR